MACFSLSIKTAATGDVEYHCFAARHQFRGLGQLGCNIHGNNDRTVAIRMHEIARPPSSPAPALHVQTRRGEHGRATGR